jgi:hypothetical protein
MNVVFETSAHNLQNTQFEKHQREILTYRFYLFGAADSLTHVDAF